MYANAMNNYYVMFYGFIGCQVWTAGRLADQAFSQWGFLI